MLATQYTFDFVMHGLDFDVVMTQTATGKTKTISVRGKSLEGHKQGISSLTDECCAGFFPKERKK